MHPAVTSVLLCLLLGLHGVLSFPSTMEEEDIPGGLDVDKRAYRPVPFPCNGYDNLPRCLHGGKGPRKTWTKSGRFCVCLCTTKWIGPECGYAAETMENFVF